MGSRPAKRFAMAGTRGARELSIDRRLDLGEVSVSGWGRCVGGVTGETAVGFYRTSGGRQPEMVGAPRAMYTVHKPAPAKLILRSLARIASSKRCPPADCTCMCARL